MIEFSDFDIGTLEGIKKPPQDMGGVSDSKLKGGIAFVCPSLED